MTIKTCRRVPSCHPVRAHYAKGLCVACYQRSRPPRKQRPTLNKVIYARAWRLDMKSLGLCQLCKGDSGGKAYCPICQEKRNQARRERRAAQRQVTA